MKNQCNKLIKTQTVFVGGLGAFLVNFGAGSGTLGTLVSNGVRLTSASFVFVGGCLATLNDTFLFILGAFGIQNGFQSHVTNTTPFFSKTVCWNARSDAVFLVRVGGFVALVAPFWRHVGGPWGPNGLLFEGFWGSCAMLGRLGRPVGSRDPLP